MQDYRWEFELIRSHFDALFNPKKYLVRAPNPDAKDPKRRYVYDLIKPDQVIKCIPVAGIKYARGMYSDNPKFVTVKNVEVFDSLERLFEKIDVQKVWPGLSVDEAVHFYSLFPGYADNPCPEGFNDRIKKYGVLAICIKSMYQSLS